jgi:hypothetical protein
MSDTQVKKIVPLRAGQKFFALQHVAFRVHAAYPRYDDMLTDVLAPEYWRHHCGVMRAGDVIECFPEGHEWYARLLVVEATQFVCKVKMLQHANLLDQHAKKESADGFKTDRNGRWWRVIRIADQSVMVGNCTDEQAAKDWIAQNCEA